MWSCGRNKGGGCILARSRSVPPSSNALQRACANYQAIFISHITSIPFSIHSKHVCAVSQPTDRGMAMNVLQKGLRTCGDEKSDHFRKHVSLLQVVVCRGYADNTLARYVLSIEAVLLQPTVVPCLDMANLG